MSIRPVSRAVASAKKEIENLSVKQLEQELNGDFQPLLLDIREIQEHVDLGTIPGAVLAPRGMLEFWADPSSQYYRDYFHECKRTILFCAAGGRSALAAKMLQEMGYNDVAHLEPGFNGWAKAKKPVEERNGFAVAMGTTRETKRGRLSRLVHCRVGQNSGLKVYRFANPQLQPLLHS